MERFIFVTDIHYGFNRGNKKGAHAPRLMGRVRRVAAKEQVDHVSEGGDRVIYTNARADRDSLILVKDEFNKFAVPVHGINGNHDENLHPDETAQILGRPSGSYSLDIRGHHNVYFSPKLEIDYGRTLVFSDDCLQWLKDNLAQNTLPAKLFVHIPIDNLEKDNAAINAAPKFIPSFAANAHEVRKILEDDGKTEFVLSGHRHRNRLRHIWENKAAPSGSGIAYITHQSLVQRNSNTGHPRGAFTLFELDERGLRATGFGVGQPSYTLPRRLKP